MPHCVKSRVGTCPNNTATCCVHIYVMLAGQSERSLVWVLLDSAHKYLSGLRFQHFLCKLLDVLKHTVTNQILPFLLKSADI